MNLKSGRVVTGIVRDETPAVLTILTANESLTVPKSDIDSREPSATSMMPDDLLKNLSDTDVQSLVAYLQSPKQVPVLATADTIKEFFNGKDLAGWIGDSKLWSVENGEIVGRSPGIKHNQFLVSDLTATDFRLSLKIKLTPNTGNSGVQFRSEPLPDGEMRGPQADAGAGWWGKLYEESARGLLWKESGEKHLKPNEWNEYTIEAIGSRVQTWINGQLCVNLDDPKISRRGVFGLQIHAGGPMEVRFKDIKLEVGDKRARPQSRCSSRGMSNSRAGSELGSVHFPRSASCRHVVRAVRSSILGFPFACASAARPRPDESRRAVGVVRLELPGPCPPRRSPARTPSPETRPAPASARAARRWASAAPNRPSPSGPSSVSPASIATLATRAACHGDGRPRSSSRRAFPDRPRELLLFGPPARGRPAPTRRTRPRTGRPFDRDDRRPVGRLRERPLRIRQLAGVERDQAPEEGKERVRVDAVGLLQLVDRPVAAAEQGERAGGQRPAKRGDQHRRDRQQQALAGPVPQGLHLGGRGRGRGQEPRQSPPSPSGPGRR